MRCGKRSAAAAITLMNARIGNHRCVATPLVLQRIGSGV
jgi:hypothetical protein